MRIEDAKIVAELAELGVELRRGSSLADLTSLGIGRTTDLLRITKHESIPSLLSLLAPHGVPHRFLGGGSNLLVGDGELRMNAGADGMQIGSYVREVKLYRAAARRIEILKDEQISFEYRHTSFAPDDMMLAVKLELPSKPYKEILQGIRICNEKRRSSQPLGQKSAGCIFKNPPGASAGRMIDDLGLKGLSRGDARVSDRHANFFVNAGKASAKDMLGLIADVRDRVFSAFNIEMEHEVVIWNA